MTLFRGVYLFVLIYFSPTSLISICRVCCCRFFGDTISSFSFDFLLCWTVFSLCLLLGIVTTHWVLVLLPVSHLLCFFSHFILVSSFSRFLTTLSPFFIWLFSLFCWSFGAQHNFLLFVVIWGIPGHPSHLWYPPSILYSHHAVTTPSCLSFSLPNACHNYAMSTHQLLFLRLFYVWYVEIRPPAPIQTHPHPPEFVITPLSWLCYMHVFSRISRSYMHPKPNPSSPSCLCLSCFCAPPCLHVPTHPCKPNCTHPYLFAPVQTLHYLCIENTCIYVVNIM